MRSLGLLAGAAIALAASPCLAVEVAGHLGLGSPTRRFDGYETKVEMGLTGGLSVERRREFWGLQGELQAAFLDGGSHSTQTGDLKAFEFSARQITAMFGPTFHLQRGRLDLALHLPVGYFVSDGESGRGAYDGPGSTGPLHLSGPAAGVELAVFWAGGPKLSIGMIAGYTYRWARQADWLDKFGSYDRGFPMAGVALRWLTTGD
jgi:hypothetical protein